MGIVGCAFGQIQLTDLRGQWFEFEGIPLLPMLSPDYLLRMPSAKKLAWKDLFALKKRLNVNEPNDNTAPFIPVRIRFDSSG